MGKYTEEEIVGMNFTAFFVNGKPCTKKNLFAKSSRDSSWKGIGENAQFAERKTGRNAENIRIPGTELTNAGGVLYSDNTNEVGL